MLAVAAAFPVAQSTLQNNVLTASAESHLDGKCAMDTSSRSPIEKQLLDAGKRASDEINLRLLFTPFEELQHSWMAFRLSDGSSDGVVYETRRDAVKHQLHEQQCFYVCFRNIAGGAKPEEMAVFIKVNRDAYNAGMRLIDPEQPYGGQELILRASDWDYYKRQGLSQ
jgi:hypothetical protein